MREIKFRAWDNYDREMMLNDELRFSEICPLEESEMFNFMQHIGLKDKNGVEIYERDILNTSYGNLIVDWNTKLCRFGFRRLQKRTKWVINISSFEEYEVIGNIYENKELFNVE